MLFNPRKTLEEVKAMLNPCKPWEEAMEKACQTGVFDPVVVARASKQAKDAGCKAASVAASAKCKELFAQVGATAYCPRRTGVVGSVPYYRYDQCDFVKVMDK